MKVGAVIDQHLRSMTAFDRLSRFNRAAKERAAPDLESAVNQFERGWQWLMLRPRTCSVVGGHWHRLYSARDPRDPLGRYKEQREAFAPLFTLAAGLAVAGVTLMRHFAQTDADRQRRITESFSKAAEQLASDKLEARLGGIYTLERISRESESDYWTVMETLTAFVRERTRRAEAERTSKPFEERVEIRAYFLWENAGKPEGRSEEFRAQAVELEKLGEPPPTDVAAVLTVINRRSKRSLEREHANEWHLDFRGAVLKKANLADAHLEGADLADAHLEGANLC